MPTPFSDLFTPTQFPELRERLLRAGIAPRHVRRYLTELTDHQPGPHNLFSLSNIYFQLDRALFFAAPTLIGWTAALLAARQRLSPAWPIAGLALIAIISSTAQVYSVHRDLATGTSNSIHLNLIPDLSTGSLLSAILRILIVLCILMLPYAAERLRHHQFTNHQFTNH